MFAYLRRDHRGHKEDKDRRSTSPSRHTTRPRTSREKPVENGLDNAQSSADPSNPSIRTSDIEGAHSSSNHDSPAEFLPPLSAPPLFDTISQSISWLETPPEEESPQELEPRPKTGSKVASSMSLSRGISRQFKKEKPPKVDTSTAKLSSLSLSLGRPQTSPPQKYDAIAKDQSPPSKPSSPWRLAFGSSKSKDGAKTSAPALGHTASGSGATPKTSLNKDTRLSSSSPSTAPSQDTLNPQDAQLGTMPPIRPSTTKTSHLSTHLHHSHDKEKRRLNLLNPMALLSRRRSGHNSAARQEEMTLPALPDDYDPRIRGRYIHDFSSPRQRNPPPLNIHRANEESIDNGLDTPQTYEASLPPSATKSSFNEYSTGSQDDSGRSNSPIPTNVDLDSAQVAHPTKEPGTTSDSQPEDVQLEDQSASLSNEPNENSQPCALGIPVHAPSNSSRFSFDMGCGEPSAQERLLEEKHKEKEAEDRAKRIQERIKNPHVKRDSESTFDDFGEFDDFDYDAMLEEDDGGYEERIPGVNADPDEEDDCSVRPLVPHFGQNAQPKPIYDENGFSATPFAGLTSAAQATGVAAPTAFSMISPVEEKDQSLFGDYSLCGMQSGIGLMNQAGSSAGDIRSSIGSAPNGFMHSPIELSRVNTEERYNMLGQQGHPLSSTDQPAGENALNMTDLTASLPQIRQERFSLTQALDDDLYFDDGLIGEFHGPIAESEGPSNESTVPFDENIFDDENSYLYDRKRAAMAAALERAAQAQAQAQTVKKQGSNLPVLAESPLREQFDTDAKPEEDDIVQYDPEQFGKKIPLKPHNTFIKKDSSQDTANKELNDYHSALAEAMNKAALEGRFDRSDSPSESRKDGNHVLAGAPGETPTDSVQASSTGDQLHSETDDMSSLVDDFEYDNMDEDYDNIIAAANADVLENDDDGFYGLEFGFYANAPPNSKVESDQMIYGGYFGERGINMDAYTQGKNGSLIHRSHSGRAADYQEPSLTPITERSEWSNRNSIISIQPSSYHMPPSGATPNSLPSHSPISQMAPEFSQSVEEPDMSYGALMKLRRDKFGGNNGYSYGMTSTPPGPSIPQIKIPNPPNRGAVASSPNSRRGSLLGTSPVYTSSLSQE